MLDLEKYKTQLEQLIAFGEKESYIPLQMIYNKIPDANEENYENGQVLDDVVEYLEDKGFEVLRGEQKSEQDMDYDAIGAKELINDIADFNEMNEGNDYDDSEDEPSDSSLENIEEAEIKISDFDNDDQSGFQSDDLIRMYLHEIGQYDLLNINQEAELSQNVQNGLAAKATLEKYEKNGKTPTEEETKKFNEKIEKGDQARNVLIVCNLRLVVSIAKNYAKNSRTLPLEDLIQEGNFGLMKAVDKFDYNRGYKFSTYATWWIRQSILRAIADKGRNVRIPVHMHESINRLARIRRRLTQELHREPTNEELAQEMKIPVDKVVDLQRVAQDSISFDNSVGDEDDSTLIDLVPDDNTANPYEYTEQLLFKQEVEAVLKTLTPREELVLRYRYGIGTDHPCTLEEVGKIMHITRERVRQIEGKALDRLGKSYRRTRLEAYIKK